MKVRMYFWDCAAAARRFKMAVNVSSLLYTAESCTLVQIAFILSYCSFFSIVIVQELFKKVYCWIAVMVRDRLRDP